MVKPVLLCVVSFIWFYAMRLVDLFSNTDQDVCSRMLCFCFHAHCSMLDARWCMSMSTCVFSFLFISFYLFPFSSLFRCIYFRTAATEVKIGENDSEQTRLFWAPAPSSQNDSNMWKNEWDNQRQIVMHLEKLKWNEKQRNEKRCDRIYLQHDGTRHHTIPYHTHIYAVYFIPFFSFRKLPSSCDECVGYDENGTKQMRIAIKGIKQFSWILMCFGFRSFVAVCILCPQMK